MSIAIELTRALPAPDGTPGEGRISVDAVGVGVFADDLGEADLDERLDPTFLRSQGFTGQARPVVRGARAPAGRWWSPSGSAPAPPTTTVATYRKAAAALARATSGRRHLALDLLDTVPEHLERPAVAQALAEGVVLGAYRYTALKSDPERQPHRVAHRVGRGGKRVQAALDRGRAVAEAVRLARDLVNQPGGTLTPTALASRAEELAALRGFDVEVLDRAAIEAEELGGLLGVNRGLRRGAPVRQAVVAPAGSPRGTVALVGKGITFDSGGLSLKTADGMIGMKGDMAGAAAVLATFSALDARAAAGRGARATCRSPTTCPAATPPGSATCCASATARPSRCSTPTPRAGWCWPTRLALASEESPTPSSTWPPSPAPAWWRSAPRSPG